MIRTILLVSLLAAALPASAGPIPNLPGGPSWPHGVGQIYMPDGLDQWQSWMGHDVDMMVVWSHPASTWAAFESGHGDIGAYFLNALKILPKTTPIVHAYPMLPEELSNKNCQNPGIWDRFAAGEFDSHYRTMAQNMKNLIQNSGRDPQTVILRLGWEMNGDWYPWSICNKVAEFKASWERAVGIIRSVMPGMRFDFSVGRPYAGFTSGRNYGGAAGVNLAGLLPSSSTYDVISRSTHDGLPFTVDDATFTQSTYNPPASSRTIGLLELRDTAAAVGKKFALSEWGSQMEDCHASGTWPTAPDPELFVRKVYAFLAANADMVAWDSYFSVSCTQLYGRQTTGTAMAYKSLWNSSGSTGGGTGGGQTTASPPKPPELVSVQ